MASQATQAGPEAYCVKCKSKRPMQDPVQVTMMSNAVRRWFFRIFGENGKIGTVSLLKQA